MKKVLYGVALTLFAGASVVSLPSCKDDINDVRTQTSYDLNKLKSQLDAEAARLDKRIDAEAAARQADIDYVKGLIQQLENKVDGNYDDLLNKINGAISRLDNIEPVVTDHENRIKELEGLAETMAAEIKALQEMDEVIWEQLDQLNQALTWVNNALMQAQEDIADLQDAVDDIIKSIDDLINQLDQEISGILIQRVKSPVFGDVSLPVGIKSTMLFNWFGYNDRGQAVTFPDGKGQFSANGDPGFSATSLGWGDENSGLAHEFVKVPDGYYEQELSLGKVYVTLNPIGKVFNNTELNLVNSQGQPLPFTVALTPSDELLTYGITRDGSTIDSGLYEGEVKFALSNDPEENEALSAVRLSIDDQLVSAMKQAVKDPSKRNAAYLLKCLYDQVNGKLPAYALEYGWSSNMEDMDPGFSGKSYRVLSQYDLAVAAARPLGFNFLAGQTGPSNVVPTISNLDNFVAELINKNLQNLDIKGDDITVLGHKIGFVGEVKFATVDNKLVATITGITVDGLTLDPIEKVCQTAETASDDVSAAIADAVITKIGATSEADKATVKASINIALLQLQKQINEVLSNVNGQIKDTFEGMGDSAESYINKVNRAVDLYNKVADKINNFFHNPNHYLQVAAFYEGGNNMGILSGDVKNPTVFTQAGGNAFNVFLSSYTGELIAPAYKKFLAVTGVYDKNGKNLNEKVGDFNKMSDDLNDVLDGSVIRVKVPASKFVPGKVYEFTYQALDYRGFTSTKKFYIEVK